MSGIANLRETRGEKRKLTAHGEEKVADGGIERNEFVKCVYGNHYFLKFEEEEHHETCLEQRTSLPQMISSTDAKYIPEELDINLRVYAKCEYGNHYFPESKAEEHYKECIDWLTVLSETAFPRGGRFTPDEPGGTLWKELADDESWEIKAECSSVNPDDYVLCLKHQVGDMDFMPMELQKEICDFTTIKFWPAVLQYLGNIFPKYRYYSFADVKEDGLDLPDCHDAITEELRYDLFQAEVGVVLPGSGNRKIYGRRLVGSIIRICKAIQKQELADLIYKIVEKSFIPDVHQDPTDSHRALFGLNVEPSTGGIQCSCCKGN